MPTIAGLRGLRIPQDPPRKELEYRPRQTERAPFPEVAYAPAVPVVEDRLEGLVWPGRRTMLNTWARSFPHVAKQGVTPFIRHAEPPDPTACYSPLAALPIGQRHLRP